MGKFILLVTFLSFASSRGFTTGYSLDGEGSDNADFLQALDFMNNEEDFETPVNRIQEAVDDLGEILSLEDAREELDRFREKLRFANRGTRQLKLTFNGLAEGLIKSIEDFSQNMDNGTKQELVEYFLDTSESWLNGSISEFKTDRFEEIAGVQIAVEVIKREVQKIMKNEPGQEELGIELLETAKNTIDEIYDGYGFLREEYPLMLEWMVLAGQTNEEMTSTDDVVSGAIEEDECKEMILNKTMMDLKEACRSFLEHTFDSTFLPTTKMQINVKA